MAEDREESQDGWRKRILDGALFEKLKKAVGPNAAERLTGDKALLETLKKALSKGGEMVDFTEDSLRKWLGEWPGSKEFLERLWAKLDDFKGDVTQLLRDELHRFFDHIDVGRELQRALTSLSLQLTMELKFVPNDKTIVRPKVERKVSRIKRVHQKGSEEKSQNKKRGE